MKSNRFAHKAKFWFWVALFVAYSAVAAGTMIDALSDRYRNLSKVTLTTVESPQELRRAGAAQVAAIYRAQSGMPFSTLPPGSTFQIVWPDGSTETVTIVSATSPLGTEPVRGTQQKARANAE